MQILLPLHLLPEQQGWRRDPQLAHVPLLQTVFEPAQVLLAQHCCPTAPHAEHF